MSRLGCCRAKVSQGDLQELSLSIEQCALPGLPVLCVIHSPILGISPTETERQATRPKGPKAGLCFDFRCYVFELSVSNLLRTSLDQGYWGLRMKCLRFRGCRLKVQGER